jgi:flagellar biosynthesis GTPase FlhF
VLWLVIAAPCVLAQAKVPEGIYTCTDDKGRRLTSDRPIPECAAKEQRVLNRDGSLKSVHPPTLTAEERAEQEARERKAAEQRAAQLDAVRRDRNLTARYPNEDAHHKAREAALDTARKAIKDSEQRLKTLAAARKPLNDEAEFYSGKALPPKLRQELDANDAASAAQRAAITTQEAELVRINRLFDAELERLRRLWAGAPPGSLGPMPVPHADAGKPPAR